MFRGIRIFPVGRIFISRFVDGLQIVSGRRDKIRFCIFKNLDDCFMASIGSNFQSSQFIFIPQVKICPCPHESFDSLLMIASGSKHQNSSSMDIFQVQIGS